MHLIGSEAVSFALIGNHHSLLACLVGDLVDPFHEVVDPETAEEAQVDLWEEVWGHGYKGHGVVDLSFHKVGDP